MEKINVVETTETVLPVFIWDLTDAAPPIQAGFHFSFQEAGGDEEVDLVGPYPTRDLALEAAGTVAHQAIRAQAEDALLSFNTGDDQ